MTFTTTTNAGGWLAGQTYGRTRPPNGWVTVQREGDVHAGDISAAVAYARHIGGGIVHCIGDTDRWLLAERVDVFVEPAPHPSALVEFKWHTVDEAMNAGWFDPVDLD